MGTPYAVLPGSDAAAAAAKAAGKSYKLDGFGASIEEILADHGVDPVTAAAVSAAGDQLAQREGGQGPMKEKQLPGLAESLVGAAVSDPRVAGNNATASFEKASAGLSQSEQEAAAITAAGDAAENAGASRATAEQKASEAIAEGVPPAMAAYAGAASAAAIAVTSNPDATPGIEIFGYLKARVTGLVTESYLASENKKVIGSTEWKIENGAFFQTSTGELYINCKNYRAEANIDHVDTDQSITKYLAGYETSAPNPTSTTDMSLTGSLTLDSRYWYRLRAAAVYKRIIYGADAYIALLGTQNAASNDAIARVIASKFVFKLYSRFYSNFR